MRRMIQLYLSLSMLVVMSCGDDKNDDNNKSDEQNTACEDSESCDSSPDTEDTDTRADSTFHAFLLLGQSNMAGYPKPLEEDLIEDERILVLGYNPCEKTNRVRNEWAVAVPPLHSCSDGLGPGDYFAKTLIEHLPEGHTIGLVPCAVNGKEIEYFMEGRRYDWIVERAQMALDKGGRIDGILFHQGESNNGQSDWPDKVATLVDHLKADLDLGDIPFLAGELLYSGSCAGHNKYIQKLPDVIENAHVISAEGLLVDETDTEWYLHFGRDAQVEFGKRYAATMIDALGLE